jgi:hypothetical protein
MGVLLASLATSTTEVEDNIDGGPAWAVLLVGPVAFATEFEDDGSRSHPVSRHPAKQNVESRNYPCGARTPGCQSPLHMRVLVHIAELG